jgi:hypothetical protein
VSAASRAAIFIGANQLKVYDTTTTAPVLEEADNGGTAGTDYMLTTGSTGLVSMAGTGGYGGGDVTTGQVLGWRNGASDASPSYGGPTCIFAAAGTYDISVQFKASSGNVLAKNRKLWVYTMDFS